MQSLVALSVAAVSATIAFSAAEPPPIPDGPQLRALAAQTVVCNNDAGDADLINGTIAASSPGDEIVFDGPCLVNKTIKLLGDRAYRGQSRTGTQIKQADGANLDAVFASDSYLDNSPTAGLPIALRALTVNANSPNNPEAHDAIVLRSRQSVVEDIEINDSARHGIRLTSLSADGTELADTLGNNRVSGNQINDSGMHGIFVQNPGKGVTGGRLLDNYVAGTGANAVEVENAGGWVINRNHIYGVDGDIALNVNRLQGTTVTDNYIENFGTIGLAARVQGGAASTIALNRIFQNAGGGTFLLVTGLEGNAKAVVNGNAIRGRGTGTGLEYQVGTALSLEVVSTTNLVSDVTVQREVGPGVVISSGQLRAADAGL